MTRLLLALSMIMVFACPAPAQETSTDNDQATNRIVLGYGHYDPLGDQPTDLRSSISADLRLGKVQVWKFHPWVGVEVNEADSSFIAAGLESDIDLGGNFILTLQTGPGYFNDGNYSRADPIYPSEGLNFRSTAELTYRLPGDARIGVSYAHLSNANTKNENPGIEAARVIFHIPLEILGRTSQPVK